MNIEIQKKAEAFICGQHILTLATAADNAPWSAPVYYIFYNSCLYFFSDPASRHITDALRSKKAAASVHSHSYGWSDIKGVQMSGEISPAGITKESASAFNTYLKKFDFIGEIKKNVSTKDISSVESVFKVKFYKFTPETIVYQDNTIRFGFKESVLSR